MTDNSSSSPQIPQSPSTITQSSPQLPPLHPQNTNPNPSPMLTSPPSTAAATFQNLQRARLTPQQQQQLTAAIASRQFSGGGGGGPQMSFGQPGQGLSMLPGQSLVQAQMLLQSRQKAGAVQGMQFNAGNSSVQGLQGMHAMGMMSSLGMNQQIRANGSLSYGQQRFNHAQLRQQQIPMQNPLTSPQKLQGQGLPRGSSLTAMNAQFSGLTQNGQSTSVQTALAQQPWLKQVQHGISSPSHLLSQHQKQQQVFSPQQPASSQLQHQKSLGLNQQQISQLHQMHLGSSRQGQPQQQQFINQQIQIQMLQQLQQAQQSPRMQGSGLQRSVSLTGSQPGTPASVTTNTGGNSSQGAETTYQLLGKRKIQELVSQVDPLGKLDPEVEGLLLEMADDFIDSVTTFACNLAKHRKSSTLESKDVLLHLEKNLHLTIPGFTKEGQKYQTESSPKDVHASRLESIRASMESQPFEGTTATGKPDVPDSSLNRPLKASPSSERLVYSTAAPQMLQKVRQF